MPAQLNLPHRLAMHQLRRGNGNDPRHVLSESSSHSSQNERQIRRTGPARTPNGVTITRNGLQYLAHRAQNNSITGTGRDNSSDNSSDDETMSATSAGQQAERGRWSRLIHRSTAADNAFSEAADRSGISESLQRVHDKRTDLQRERRALAGVESKLKKIRTEKSGVDQKLHLLTLSCSMNDTVPPRKEVISLYSTAQQLQMECDALESKHDDLKSKLERKTIRLEAHENGLLRNFASGAAESHANASGIMERLPNNLMTAGARHQPIIQTGVEPRQPTEPRTPIQSTRAQTNKTLSPQKRREMRSALMGISNECPRNEHPMFVKLLRTIGELNLAKEGLNELEAERDEILYELQNTILRERSRTGANYNAVELQVALRGDSRSANFKKLFAGYLAADDLDYLQGWYIKSEDLRAKISAKQRQVDQMRIWCKEMDLLPSYMSFEEQESVLGAVIQREEEADAIGEDIDAALERAKFRDPRIVLAHRGFPHLLTNPCHLMARVPMTAKAAVSRAFKMPDDHPDKPRAKADGIKEYGIETVLERFVEGKKPDFINRWLLQQLRMSPLEAVRLFMIMSDILRVYNVKRWQDDVMYHWSLDVTNERNNYHSIAGSLETPDGQVSESMSSRAQEETVQEI